MTPRASIITTLYGGRAVTERMLASLERALGDKLGTEFELILVDNASPDDTGELLDRWEDRATILRQRVNLNFGGGNNVAAQSARGDVLVFLNNDTEVPPGTIEALVDEASAPDVVAAGCRLLYPDGSVQHAGMAFMNDPHLGVPVPFHLFRHEAGDLPSARGVLELDAVTAALMAMRRDLFLQLGGFDEDYVNGHEDVDLLFRARVRTGGRIVYRGDVAAVHHEGLTRGITEADSSNRNLFYSRWGELLDQDTEAIAGAFGGRFSPFGMSTLHPADTPTGRPVTIHASLLGIGPESDEARALLDAAVRGGIDPAVRSLPVAWVVPSVPDAALLPLQRGHNHPQHPDAFVVSVPVGAWQPLPDGTRAVLRLGRVPAGGVGRPAAVWAATERLVEELVAAGAPADRTAWLPPAVAAPLGAGGGGVLAVLPVHQPALAGRVLDALAALEGVRVRLAPTVGGPATAALVAERLPAAELLAPLSDEGALAALAGASDAVVAIDPADPYGRRALVAAASGAAPVAAGDSAAGEVLGDLLHAADGADAAAIEAAIRQALADASPRDARAAAVAAVCAPDVVAARLTTLVEQLFERREPPPFDLGMIAS
jgi:GT2 family glycosyltransferase